MVQSLLVIALLVVITVGMISSYVLVTQDMEYFRPRGWADARRKYLEHVEKAALDPPLNPPPLPQEPQVPYFRVTSILRHPKIEDEEYQQQQRSLKDSGSSTADDSGVSLLQSRQDSHHSGVPFGAKVYRASWRTPESRNSSFNSTQSSRHYSCCSFRGASSNSTLAQPLLPQERQRTRR